MGKSPRKSFPGIASIQITDPTLSPKHKHKIREEDRFQVALESPIADIDEIRENAWKGIPDHLRARSWRLFLDYEPLSKEFAEKTLTHKRQDYFNCLDRLYSESQRAIWTSTQRRTVHQITIDLPRTQNKIMHDERVKLLFEHVLFVWAVRHPACGYVQGMNDILLPFFVVFLSQHIECHNVMELINLPNIDSVSDEKLREVEGDCFWCFSKLLDGIQDMFTKDQPGLFRMMKELECIIDKVDASLANVFKEQEVQIDQFAFPWMNCLLVRQFQLPMLLRVWDLYISEVTKVSKTHVYVCAAMLEVLSPKIKENPVDCLLYMQALTPEEWTDDDLETILAQSYVLESTYPF